MSTPKLRVFLAEEHLTVREGLKMILNAQPDIEVVGEADDGRTTLARVQELMPEIVVMDISMPDLNGLKATEKLTECCPQVKVLTLTRHRDDAYLQQIIRAGAAGYVLKQSPPTELLHAIRAVAKGGKYLDPAVAGKVMGRFVDKQPVTFSEGASLTHREEEVLQLIALGHSSKEIAARLDLSTKTVEAHKANAMKKLDIHSRIDVVRYAMLKGWLDEG